MRFSQQLGCLLCEVGDDETGACATDAEQRIRRWCDQRSQPAFLEAACNMEFTGNLIGTNRHLHPLPCGTNHVQIGMAGFIRIMSAPSECRGQSRAWLRADWPSPSDRSCDLHIAARNRQPRGRDRRSRGELGGVAQDLRIHAIQMVDALRIAATRPSIMSLGAPRRLRHAPDWQRFVPAGRG